MITDKSAIEPAAERLAQLRTAEALYAAKRGGRNPDLVAALDPLQGNHRS